MFCGNLIVLQIELTDAETDFFHAPTDLRRANQVPKNGIK
jgi:hypothetical protein